MGAAGCKSSNRGVGFLWDGGGRVGIFTDAKMEEECERKRGIAR